MNLKQTIGIFLISLTVGFGYAQEKKINKNIKLVNKLIQIYVFICSRFFANYEFNH